jgi:hypothetical protein
MIANTNTQTTTNETAAAEYTYLVRRAKVTMRRLLTAEAARLLDRGFDTFDYMERVHAIGSANFPSIQVHTWTKLAREVWSDLVERRAQDLRTK